MAPYMKEFVLAALLAVGNSKMPNNLQETEKYTEHEITNSLQKKAEKEYDLMGEYSFGTRNIITMYSQKENGNLINIVHYLGKKKGDETIVDMIIDVILDNQKRAMVNHVLLPVDYGSSIDVKNITNEYKEEKDDEYKAFYIVNGAELDDILAEKINSVIVYSLKKFIKAKDYINKIEDSMDLGSNEKQDKFLEDIIDSLYKEIIIPKYENQNSKEKK